MASAQPCAKYQYVLTTAGPKIVPVPDQESKDEESPADYNAGGYLPVKVDDSFEAGRYLVLRKLGYVLRDRQPVVADRNPDGAISQPSGWSRTPSA
jgi:hypothetical protein